MSDSAHLALEDQTDVGSYFIANYPPFSVWTKEAVDDSARPALSAAPSTGVPLGLYLHIPFCRKRCHFCYCRVYTDKNAQEVAEYLADGFLESAGEEVVRLSRDGLMQVDGLLPRFFLPEHAEIRYT